MSTSDKTGDRLAASIRRTKAGAAKPSAIAPEAAQAEEKTPPAKPAARPAAKPAPKAAPRRTKPAAAPAPSAGDSYQFGRRVWPD